MSKGLSERQHAIYELVDRRSRQGLVTTSLDVVAALYSERSGDTSFRKSIWRSLVSLERRKMIRVYSNRPRKRERGPGNVIRFATGNFREVTDHETR